MPPPKPKSIAIIGGGITGLSAAFHLSTRFPTARITLFEQSPRLGGWINSRRVQISDRDGRSARVCLESGPRTLRPNSQAILELIHKLNLTREVISTPRSSPAARNRFLQIPGTKGLTALPSSPLSFLASPFLTSLIALPALREPFRRPNRVLVSSSSVESIEAGNVVDDESVDSFLSRRFGNRFARVLGSALVHGIYAADSRLLSVRAAFPSLWDAETRGNGSVVRGFLRREQPSSSSPSNASKVDDDSYDVGDVPKRMKNVSAYSFRDGMETLPRALAEEIRNTKRKQNVTIRAGETIVGLRFGEEHPDAEIKLAKGDETLRFSHVVTTIPLPKLQSILSPNDRHHLPHLTANPTSTVTVINIVFPPTKNNQRPIHPPGFGYLVPRPESDDYYGSSEDENSSGFLGTVFDSCALSAQDTGDAGFTKLTVMMGGPHHPHLSLHNPAYSSPSHVLTHLAAHLGHHPGSLPEPVLYETFVQKDCIPTPTVGHLQRMAELRRVLGDERGPWKGRLEVIGAGVGGVSVGDCVEAGRRAGSSWE